MDPPQQPIDKMNPLQQSIDNMDPPPHSFYGTSAPYKPVFRLDIAIAGERDTNCILMLPDTATFYELFVAIKEMYEVPPESQNPHYFLLTHYSTKKQWCVFLRPDTKPHELNGMYLRARDYLVDYNMALVEESDRGVIYDVTRVEMIPGNPQLVYPHWFSGPNHVRRQFERTLDYLNYS